MKIVILTTSQNYIGGVERFVEYLRSGLVSHGYEVDVVAQEQLSSIERIFISLAQKIGLGPVALGWRLGSHVGNARVVITNGVLGWTLRGDQKRKVINVQHGTFAKAAERVDYSTSKLKYIIKRWIWGTCEGIAARNATTCISVSDETAQSVQQLYHASSQVIHNAVDTLLFHPMNRRKKQQVIFVGRFEYAKGEAILHALQKYLQENGWTLLVAERLSQEELVRAYNESELFVLPSLHEGCSYALLDAMACGLPFLTSPVGQAASWQAEGVFTENIVASQNPQDWINACELILAKSLPEKQRDAQIIRSYIVEHHELSKWMMQFIKLLE